MLIDDQPMIGEAVRRMLAGEPDIVFHYCRTPPRPSKRPTGSSPTVILQDLVMPDIDGLTLVKTFRAHEPTRETPMIVLSTKEEPTVKAEAFALGANDYIVKLPDRLELLARIRYHSKGYINLLQRNEAYQALLESQQRLANEMKQAAHYVRSLLPDKLKQGADPAPTGDSSRRPSWGATRSATTGSTTTTSPSTCSTSAATASARPCSRSRP